MTIAVALCSAKHHELQDLFEFGAAFRLRRATKKSRNSKNIKTTKSRNTNFVNFDFRVGGTRLITN